MMENTEKEKALDVAISQIEKQFGKGSIMRLGESVTDMSVASLPTGSLSGYSTWYRRHSQRQDS